MRKFHHIFFWILFFQTFFLFGQEQYAMSQGNYSPTSAMLHNPTAVVNSKVLLDIHLIGADFFLYNNYAFLQAKEFNYFDFVKSGNIPDARYDNTRKYYNLFSNVDFQLLSATYQYKEHGFGFYSRIRTFADIRRMPQAFTGGVNVGYINGNNTEPNLNNFNRELSAEGLSITTLAYDDIGVTYANAIHHFDYDLIIVGGGIKYLLGVAGGGILADELNYSIDTSDVFTFNNLDIIAGGAEGDYGDKLSQWFAGKGFAFDLGITYKKMLHNVRFYDPFTPEAKCRPYDYKWKVSASIMDFGRINFKKNASLTEATASSGSVENFSSLDPSSDPENFISQELGPTVSSTTSNSFKMWVPGALVLQADFNLRKNFYFAAQYTIGLRHPNSLSIQRPDVLYLAPRYERRWFEIMVPFAMYNYSEVRTGLAIRIAGLTLGTDKLGTILSITNVTGFDFYFHYAIKFYKKKGCRESKGFKDYDVTKCRKY